MSDNAEWYSDFYKKHKRKPNKAELWEMARKVYMGNGMKYGMAEYQFEATDEMQEDFDALGQEFANLEALNNIKDKISDLTASEMAVMQGLSPSGYKVYQMARKQFEQGNAEVQKAGRMNAILLARYADRMAENITKITGKPYTAEDYMRERMHIVADATEVDEGGYGQAAMNVKRDLSKRYSLLDIDSLIDGVGVVGEDEISVEKVKAFIESLSQSGVKVTTEDLSSVFNFDGISDHSKNHIVLAHSQKGRKSRKTRIARNKILSNAEQILSKAILVEVQPTKHSDSHYKEETNSINSYRFVIPVKMNKKPQVLVITAVGTNTNILQHMNDVELYEVYNKKSPSRRMPLYPMAMQ